MMKDTRRVIAAIRQEERRRLALPLFERGIVEALALLAESGHGALSTIADRVGGSYFTTFWDMERGGKRPCGCWHTAEGQAVTCAHRQQPGARPQLYLDLGAFGVWREVRDGWRLEPGSMEQLEEAATRLREAA